MELGALKAARTSFETALSMAPKDKAIHAGMAKLKKRLFKIANPGAETADV